MIIILNDVYIKVNINVIYKRINVCIEINNVYSKWAFSDNMYNIIYDVYKKTYMNTYNILLKKMNCQPLRSFKGANIQKAKNTSHHSE